MIIRLSFTPKSDKDLQLFQEFIDASDFPFYAELDRDVFYFEVQNQEEAYSIEMETVFDKRMHDISGYWQIED
jgi:hypothetical protein